MTKIDLFHPKVEITDAKLAELDKMRAYEADVAAGKVEEGGPRLEVQVATLVRQSLSEVFGEGFLDLRANHRSHYVGLHQVTGIIE